MKNEEWLKQFDFNLPCNLIASEPAEPRDSSRLLIFDVNSGKISLDSFSRLSQYLPEESVLVFNNTKVIKARLNFVHNSKACELFFLEDLGQNEYKVMVRPGKLFRQGSEVHLPAKILCKVKRIDDDGTRVVELSKNVDLGDYLEKYGEIPLPPYIEANDPNKFASSYQTVYADKGASVAAPTAGLHFTNSLLSDLKNSGFGFQYVNLEVGLGTFAPLRDRNISDNKLHSENFSISKSTAQYLNRSKRDKRKIVSVGTTTLRVLETSYANGVFNPIESSTDIFIKPGYHDFSVDGLITNFHLPKSSLFVLIAAFIGTQNAQSVYKYAIANKLRFYSFGDACLFLR